MQFIETIGNDWNLLFIVTKSYVLDVYGLLDLTPVIALYYFVSQKISWGLVNRLLSEGWFSLRQFCGSNFPRTISMCIHISLWLHDVWPFEKRTHFGIVTCVFLWNLWAYWVSPPCICLAVMYWDDQTLKCGVHCPSFKVLASCLGAGLCRESYAPSRIHLYSV